MKEDAEGYRDVEASLAEKQLSLAADQKTLSMALTHMATERTFNSWIRTGIAAVVAGLGIASFLARGGATGIARAIGVIFILAGASIYIVALMSYRHMYLRMPPADDDAIDLFRFRYLLALVLALILGALLSLLLLFR
jgi:putative membrane protein